MYSVGCVHGRFQLPHLGHQEYILKAMELCEFLWIGIARPDIREHLPCTVAKHRANTLDNPLTYYERMMILREILLDCAKNTDDFGFIPFPIDQPERLPDFLPTSIPCLTTIYDDWNRHKIKELERIGYKVGVLWERSEKKYSGHIIRQSIIDGSTDWEGMVSTSTRRAILDLQIRERLLSLSQQ
ncbi:adenylyltransferase/cytidyltransferase family protein [Nitrospira sp. KM1]|uniref:adenylyltransferase/cytidyltransferase family protein n=1 Tax=Nitrospira sp. KM1 TaxID=1936990 RepID=UPI00351A6E79